MKNLKASYSAASTFPVKLLKSKVIDNNRIIPYHIQLCPINKCNLKCSFCCFRDRNQDLQLELHDIKKLLKEYASLGARAITITGGGEPFLHPDINEILETAQHYGLQIGVTSNGLCLNKIINCDLFTWARISASDESDISQLFKKISPSICRFPKVDWAFSYILTENPNWQKINEVIEFANSHNFSHVRIRSDVLNLDTVVSMETVAQKVNADLNRVVFQGRKDATKGDKKCLVSLLKPMIAPDGYIYPCCGVAYALNEIPCGFPKSMRMGHMTDLKKIFTNQEWFDGSVCSKCYYKNYNDILDIMISEINHESFI